VSKLYLEFLTGVRTQLHAGVPIKTALSNLSSHGRAGRFAAEVLEHLERGKSFAESLANARSFRVPSPHVALIDAGETSGRLDDIVGKIRDDLERARESRSKIITRLLYPIVILCLAVLLPPLYLVLSGRADEYLRVQLSFFGPVALLAIAWGLRGKIVPPHSALRELLQNVVRAIPLLGRFLVENALARALSTLGLMLRSGLGFEASLPLVARASGWKFLENEFLEIEKSIRDGATASEGLCGLTGLPKEFHSVIATGETAGTLDEALDRCGRGLEDRANTRIDRFVRIAPVVAILLVGLVVGALAISAFSKALGV